MSTQTGCFRCQSCHWRCTLLNQNCRKQNRLTGCSALGWKPDCFPLHLDLLRKGSQKPGMPKLSFRYCFFCCEYGCNSASERTTTPLALGEMFAGWNLCQRCTTLLAKHSLRNGNILRSKHRRLLWPYLFFFLVPNLLSLPVRDFTTWLNSSSQIRRILGVCSLASAFKAAHGLADLKA